jgi:hypothetical protein
MALYIVDDGVHQRESDLIFWMHTWVPLGPLATGVPRARERFRLWLISLHLRAGDTAYVAACICTESVPCDGRRLAA